MSLARDFSQFADQVNADLDGIVNTMAEAKEESQKLNELIFDRLGSIASKLEVVARIETDMATVKRLVTSLHDGHVGDMRDVRYRLGVLEAKAKNVTHPAEEITPPHPRPSLPR